MFTNPQVVLFSRDVQRAAEFYARFGVHRGLPRAYRGHTHPQATYEALTADHVSGLHPPHVWLDRLLIAWVADPDGHPVQLVQPHEG